MRATSGYDDVTTKFDFNTLTSRQIKQSQRRHFVVDVKWEQHLIYSNTTTPTTWSKDCYRA